MAVNRLSRVVLLMALCAPAGGLRAAEPVLSFVVGSERLDLSARDVASAEPHLDANSFPSVLFTMVPAQARAFADLTSRNIGKPMDLLVCGRLMLSPVIRSPITGGGGMISGTFSTEETVRLARVLKTGLCSALTS
jgi:preprotein translocase subunit SecD